MSRDNRKKSNGTRKVISSYSSGRLIPISVTIQPVSIAMTEVRIIRTHNNVSYGQVKLVQTCNRQVCIL